MWTGLSLFAAITGSFNAESSVAGVYKLVPSSTPAQDRQMVEMIFGGAPIGLNRSGEFVTNEGLPYGYWRVSGSRIVVTFTGVGGLTFPLPTEVIKKRWPKNSLEGLVFDIGNDGSLTTRGFGKLKGPIVFRKQPRLSTYELVLSPIPPLGPMAYSAVMYEEAGERLEDLLKIATDPKIPHAKRTWALSFVPRRLTREQCLRMLDFARKFSSASIPANEVEQLRRNIAVRALRGADSEIFEAVCKELELFKLTENDLLRRLVETRVSGQLGRIQRGLESADEETLAYACAAASATSSRDTVPRLRELTSHPDSTVQIEAWRALAKMSPQMSERLMALRKLQGHIDSPDFAGFNVVRGWKESGLREAVGYLVWCLERHPDPDYRRLAAEALGELGYPEAVPALLRVKAGLEPDGNEGDRPKIPDDFLENFDRRVSDSTVRQAVADALWKFDQKAKGRAKK